MYAVKKLTVIGRTQSKEDDVERITAENHRRRREIEEANAWEQFMADRERKADRAATIRSWMLVCTVCSFTLFGVAISMTAFLAAMGDMGHLSASTVFLCVSLIAGLICAAKLER